MNLSILAVSGVSDDVANAALGGELAGRIIGSVILAYLVTLLLRLVYKGFQGARSVLLNGEWRTEKIRSGLDCVPWWLMFLVFAVQFCTFTKGWREIPESMCFALIVCLAVVFILWNKQRHGKRTRDEAKTNGASITAVQSAEFTFACPHCGQHLSADADMIGMQVACPACQNNFTVQHSRFGEMNHCSIETTRSKRNIPLFALLCIISAGTIAEVIIFFSNLSEAMEMLLDGFAAFIALSSSFISLIVIKWGVSWWLMIKLSTKKHSWLRRAGIFWFASACIASILQYSLGLWILSVLFEFEIREILTEISMFDFIPEVALIAATVILVQSKSIRSILVTENQSVEEKVAGQRFKIYGNLAGLAISIVLLPVVLGFWAGSGNLNPNPRANSKTNSVLVAPIFILWWILKMFHSLTEACNGDVKKSRDEKSANEKEQTT